MFSVNAFAEGAQSKNFQRVQQELAKTKQISGEFKQIHKIKILSSPLISSGSFSLTQKGGLIWKQKTPFVSLLKVTDSTMEQKLGNNPPTRFTKEKQPIIFSFTKVFLSIFKGNTQLLKRYFTINFTGSLKSWSIRLKPIGSPLNKAITSIHLYGDRQVNKVVIDEVRGNKLTIEFYNIKTS